MDVKEVEIDGRKFMFKVPSAWNGCAIFNMMTTYNVPFGAARIIGMTSTRQIMPPDQLEVFMKMCLKNCGEVKDAGLIPVVDEDGSIGIIGATGPLLTKITAQYMLFFMEYWQTEIH